MFGCVPGCVVGVVEKFKKLAGDGWMCATSRKRAFAFIQKAKEWLSLRLVATGANRPHLHPFYCSHLHVCGIICPQIVQWATGGRKIHSSRAAQTSHDRHQRLFKLLAHARARIFKL